ncbi:MAG: hypothetical protein ACOYB1_10720 [Limnohabitans sp.]
MRSDEAQSPCLERQGRCLQWSLGGIQAEALTDMAKRAPFSKLISGIQVSWLLSQQLLRHLIVASKAGFFQMARTVIEDRRLYQVPFGQTRQWPVAAEYVLTFSVHGTGNWDRQSVWVKAKAK